MLVLLQFTNLKEYKTNIRLSSFLYAKDFLYSNVCGLFHFTVRVFALNSQSKIVKPQLFI